MATTATSQLAASSIVVEGKDRVKKVSGKLAGSYLPGDVVYQTAADTWTQCVGSASHQRMSYGWIEFKKRTSSTFGEVDIDATYTDGTAINVEIIIGPKDGTIKLISKCEDLGAAYYYGEVLTAFSAGSLQRWEGQQTGNQVAIVTEEPYVNGSTRTKIYMV